MKCIQVNLSRYFENAGGGMHVRLTVNPIPYGYWGRIRRPIYGETVIIHESICSNTIL